MDMQTVPQIGSTRSRPTSSRAVNADPVLEEAVARITELTRRLRSVGSVHTPRRTRFSGRPRCTACGASSPCPTLLAAGLVIGKTA